MVHHVEVGMTIVDVRYRVGKVWFAIGCKEDRWND